MPLDAPVTTARRPARRPAALRDASGVSSGYDIAVPPRLLVSVVAPDEVEAALEGGADVVDVKNPAEGSLGAPLPRVLLAVRRACLRPSR